MKKTTLTLFSSLILSGFAQARTWTSADGSKTFEGDFVSSNDSTVTIKRGIRNMTFKSELLSEEDRKWIKAENIRIVEAEANEAAAAEFAESKFGKALGKLQKLDGEKFCDHKLTEPPRHFLLYFSASWCGPCRANAPAFADQYRKEIATNPDLEVIHISLDRADDAAIKWAQSFKEPWPVMLPSDTDQDTLVKPYNVRAVPTYILVDQTGKEIARGKAAALAAAKKAQD